MPTLKSFIESKLEEFEKGCNTDNISDPPSDQEWIKEFISQILKDQAKLIEEMVVGEAYYRVKDDGKYFQYLADGYDKKRQEVINNFQEYRND